MWLICRRRLMAKPIDNNAQPQAMVSWLHLPYELREMILEYLEPDADGHCELMLLRKEWHAVLLKRRLESLRISARMALSIFSLSWRFIQAMQRGTKNLTITLGQWTAAVSALEGDIRDVDIDIQQLNYSLQYVGALLSSFEALEAFTFAIYIERGTSWTVVHLETFEYMLSCLARLSLKTVHIDLPGAPRENRDRMHLADCCDPHICEILARSFPDTEVLHLQLQRICPRLFEPARGLSRLRQVIVDLSLEQAEWQMVAIDGCVVDCRHPERLGRQLFETLQPAAAALVRSPAAPNLEVVEFIWRPEWGRDFEGMSERIWRVGRMPESCVDVDGE
ncbi:hypothetical protein BJX64DRAFT_293122 [Aspergillus heterothallicus]